jgi:cyclophilin family peptidyl-prolyl cis-trans isomerase
VKSPATALPALLAGLILAAVLAGCGAGPRPTATALPATAVPAARPGSPAASPASAKPKSYAAPPPLTIDVNKQYVATIKTTMGDIKVQLDAKNAPATVNNFIFLARDGFYDGTPFHRIIKGFMIQGGDPTGTGTGGPGYKFNDETPKGGYDVGSIAMANSGPNTNGSQFFICEGDQCKTLPPSYNLFGKVVDGIDVVHKIAAVSVTTGSDGQPSKPLQDVRIQTVQIAEQ